MPPSPALRTSKLLCWSLALTLGLVALPAPLSAQIFIPPDRGLPGRREGGGTRGDCAASQIPLTALIPDTNFGKTLQEYPTFFWYVPPIETQAAEFVLMDEDQNEIYYTQFEIEEPGGIISISLPASGEVPALELGKDYRWYFALICDVNDRSRDIFAEGWVQRISPDPEFIDELNRIPMSDRPNLYAREGIWFDALMAFVQLRQAEPTNPTVRSDWFTFLESVDLEQLSEQPFIACCGSELDYIDQFSYR